MKGRKLITFALIIVLVMHCPLLNAKEGHGEQLKIVDRDGGLLEGELIAVKPDSLLLLSGDGRDVVIDVADIDTVQIVKSSKVGIGLLVGAAAGIATAVIISSTQKHDLDRGLWRVLGIPLFGSLGIAVGGVVGLMSSRSETIKIDEASEPKLRAALTKLRKQARLRDVR